MPKRPYDSRYWRNKVRPGILRRDGYRCQLAFDGICTQRATAVDHIIPWADGGPWYEPWNLRAVCAPCNTHRQRAPDPTTHNPSRNW